VWRSGDVIFKSDDPTRELQGSIGAAAAEQLIADVARRLRDVPAHDQTKRMSDAPTVEIAVRDGGTWRIADVYGAMRGDHRPAGFAQAYRELVAARPKQGTAFQPVDILVHVAGYDSALGDPLPWPSDVPAPAPTLVPRDDGISDSFIVDAKFRPSLEQLIQAASRGNPPWPIGFNGHKWSVHPIARFRGQEHIEAVLECARDE